VLETSLAPVKVQVGRQLTKGLGAGSNPEIGRQAALEDRATIMDALDGMRYGLHHLRGWEAGPAPVLRR